MKKIVCDEQLKYLERFNKEKNELIIEMEAFAAENRIPILDSNSAFFLEQLIQIQKPVRVLELGAAIGYSAIRIARNLSKKSCIHTIEKSEDNIQLAESYISRSGFANKIRLIKGEAAEIMPSLPKKYDFIFLDADKEDYKRLFDYSLVLLKKNGILFVDNLLWHGFTAASRVPKEYKRSTKMIREFNEIFLNQAGLKATILTIGDGIGLAVKLKTEK
ncbi:MAG TPA: O-methyltransferase [Ignavibacteriaceae bacterium]|nr:O-methyltransferase [Ignavibacteriaceae bacterium]